MPICHVKRDVDIYVHVRQTKTYITGEEIRENVNSKTIFCLLSVEKKNDRTISFKKSKGLCWQMGKNSSKGTRKQFCFAWT